MYGIEIWNNDGDLLPLDGIREGAEPRDAAAIIVNRDRPDLTDALARQVKRMGRGLRTDTYVIEMGSKKRSAHESFHYDDDDFRGKCYGHNVGLRLALQKAKYRYFWILMNDIQFPPGADALGTLIETADEYPKIGILSPAEPEGTYADCRRRDGSDYHVVSTCDYLGFLIRRECVKEAGFLNPHFRYCWGAIHELAHKINKKGWVVAYCDKVTMKHLGGTTYGRVANTIPREEYQRRAKEFAARYFVDHYGENWDRVFTEHLPEKVEINTFELHRAIYEGALPDPERRLYRSSAAGNMEERDSA